jgi:hypothetical protein
VTLKMNMTTEVEIKVGLEIPSKWRKFVANFGENMNKLKEWIME